MEAIASKLVAQLIQEFCEKAPGDSTVKSEINLKKQWAFDFPPAFRFSNTTGPDPVKLMDDELETVSYACDYLIQAITSFAEQARAVIGARRNQHIPVYRLSNDILAIIFEEAKECSTNWLRPLATKVPLNVAHVSAQWRSVALHTPRLWTILDAMNAHIAPIFLDRSRHALLHIDLASSDYIEFSDDEDTENPRLRLPVPRDKAERAYRRELARFSDFIQPLLPHMDRWGTLSLEGFEESELGRFTHTPAPNLTTLYLRRHLGTQTPSDITLFNGHTPRLRLLELYGFGLPLKSSIYTNLTSLFLEDIDFEDSTTRDLAQIFIACPLLEEIVLQAIRLHEFHSDASLCVPLRHLEWLALREMAVPVVHELLTFIAVPPSLQLHVSLDGDDKSLIDIIPPNNMALPNIRAMDWLYFEFHSHAEKHFMMKGGMLEDGKWLLDLCLFYTSSPDDLIANLAEGLPMLCLGSLKSLAFKLVADAEEISAGLLKPLNFLKLVSNCPNLTSITLSGADPRLLELLTFNLPMALCPQLQELRLQDMEVSSHALIELAESRTTKFFQTAQPPADKIHFSSIEMLNCPGVDPSTQAALRNLLPRVHIHEPNSRITPEQYGSLEA
ncbi:hypothetical protein BOTBODRAFT_608079 [Botryobasidium botryosum FD-172 SS1]|uniref:F-box domain-containing protein n=1 Tax=Botryobasidium botryosum (strain FD-172 SS1) TaxID=930990 RepID=A0A067LW03_BOTB1|nr:hypothetical protein BOTBODRAFT_608079 [Botryobasidium botryosum FD-172 SS1]